MNIVNLSKSNGVQITEALIGENVFIINRVIYVGADIYYKFLLTETGHGGYFGGGTFDDAVDLCLSHARSRVIKKIENTASLCRISLSKQPFH